MASSLADIVATLSAAGFSGDNLAMGASIVMAESGGNAYATNTNGPTSGCPNGSRDEGWWQINNCYHSIGQECAFSPKCSTSYAYKISDGGRNFTPWAAYNENKHLQYLPLVRAYLSGSPNIPPPDLMVNVPDVDFKGSQGEYKPGYEGVAEDVQKNFSSQPMPTAISLASKVPVVGDVVTLLWNIKWMVGRALVVLFGLVIVVIAIRQVGNGAMESIT